MSLKLFHFYKTLDRNYRDVYAGNAGRQQLPIRFAQKLGWTVITHYFSVCLKHHVYVKVSHFNEITRVIFHIKVISKNFEFFGYIAVMPLLEINKQTLEIMAAQGNYFKQNGS